MLTSLFNPARSAGTARTTAALALAGGLLAGAAIPAQAHPTGNSALSRTATLAPTSGSEVLQVASRYVGTPYRWGGTTPAGFDCSGFTGYIFSQVGVDLPRTATAQMQATRRVSAAEARPGDLVFFVSGGRAYHNGIYAGDGLMYDSPRSGKSVSLRMIWTTSVVYGRAL